MRWSASYSDCTNAGGSGKADAMTPSVITSWSQYASYLANSSGCAEGSWKTEHWQVASAFFWSRGVIGIEKNLISRLPSVSFLMGERTALATSSRVPNTPFTLARTAEHRQLAGSRYSPSGM